MLEKCKQNKSKKKELSNNYQRKNKYQSDSHRSRSEFSSNSNDFLQRNITVVLDILFFLLITERFFESLNDIGRSSGDNFDLSLTVLANKLNSDIQTLPGLSSLDNIIRNLLSRLNKE